MKQKYSYVLASTLTAISGITFTTQLILDFLEIARREGTEWVVPATGIVFACALVYSLVLIILNARED